MNADHFRRRAEEARETAQHGGDIQLSRILFEVARDLDAEAEAIEANATSERRGFPRLQPAETLAGETLQAWLHVNDFDADPRRVEIINLSIGGARFLVDRPLTPGSEVKLELSAFGLRLSGTILRVPEAEAAMVFDATSRANPELARVLKLTSSASHEPV